MANDIEIKRGNIAAISSSSGLQEYDIIFSEDTNELYWNLPSSLGGLSLVANQIRIVDDLTDIVNPTENTFALIDSTDQFNWYDGTAWREITVGPASSSQAGTMSINDFIILSNLRSLTNVPIKRLTGNTFSQAELSDFNVTVNDPSPVQYSADQAVKNLYDKVTNLSTEMSDYVPITRTINTKALSSDIVLDKQDIGLSNVDNTSDLDKPISTNMQSALDQKVNTTLTINGKTLTTDLNINKNDIGLGNVNNTSDLNKPISNATQVALDLKVPTTRKINDLPLDGDITIDKTDIGLGNVDNTRDQDKPVSIATLAQLNQKVPMSRTINGLALTSNISLTKMDIGLSNVDNTSDADKPISTSTQTALDTKAQSGKYLDNISIPQSSWTAITGGYQYIYTNSSLIENGYNIFVSPKTLTDIENIGNQIPVGIVDGNSGTLTLQVSDQPSGAVNIALTFVSIS